MLNFQFVMVKFHLKSCFSWKNILIVDSFSFCMPMPRSVQSLVIQSWWSTKSSILKFWTFHQQHLITVMSCLGMSCPSWQCYDGIELAAVGLQFKPYWWCPCGVTWDSSLTVVVIKLLLTSAAAAAAACTEPGSFAQALHTLLVSKKGQNLNKYTTLSTWRDYGPGPLGPPLILW